MQRSVSQTHLLIAALIAVGGLSIPASAASQASPLTFYASRADFNAAAPGLPLEVFQPINSPAVISAPLSSTTNNGDFVPGSILPGISIRNQNPALSSTGLYIDGSSVACNWFGDPMVLTFAPGVSAFAADFFASSGGSSWAGTFTAGFYSGKKLLGGAKFTEGAGQTSFLGLTSTTLITRIIVNFYPSTDVDWAPHVENIAFGASGASPVDNAQQQP
jgi:hypothetical protein